MRVLISAAILFTMGSAFASLAFTPGSQNVSANDTITIEVYNSSGGHTLYVWEAVNSGSPQYGGLCVGPGLTRQYQFNSGAAGTVTGLTGRAESSGMPGSVLGSADYTSV